MDSLKRFYLRRIKTNEELYTIIPFKTDQIVIGRSPEATFNIPNSLISRKHAVFSRSTTPDKWIVKNLSLNGVFVNNQLIPKEEEKEVEVGDVIQFGMPANFVYRLGMKIIGSSRSGSSSHVTKRIKVEEYGTDSQEELTQEHASLEKRLQDCDALKARLQEEQDSMKNSVSQQREALEQKYKEDRHMLEQKYAAGALAQQCMLDEKEDLARELENQVRALQSQLELQQCTLEERLKKEEEERRKIIQEKEEVFKRLEEEKIKLELRMQEERKNLQEQLKVTESYREELQKKVEEKECLIKAKEEEQLKANEEKEQLKDQLAQEKQALQEELESVQQALEEKNKKYSDLHSELKFKEEEMQDRMLSLESGVQERVYAELEKSSALAKRQLDDLIKDKTELEEKLKQTQKHDKEELSNLQEALSTVEAQKLSLEQELACSALASDNARKEVVDSVADVLENELQCPICNELFINAMMLGCGHTFCKYCIGQWKKNKKECPNCRGNITSETRSLVIDNFIDKIVPTLSDELQKRRSEIVSDRAREIATMEAQAAAQAAASTNRGGRRGRGRGRNAQRQQNRPPQENAITNTVSMNILRSAHSVVLAFANGTRALIGTQTQARLPVSDVQIPTVISTSSSTVVPASNHTVPAIAATRNVVQTPTVTSRSSSMAVTPISVAHVPFVTLSVASTTRTLTTSTQGQPITIIVPRTQDSSATVSQHVVPGSNQNLPLTSNAVSLPGTSTNPIVIGSSNDYIVGGISATARPPLRGKCEFGSLHSPIYVGFNNEILTYSTRANQTRRGRSTRDNPPTNPPAQPQVEAGELLVLSSDGSETTDTSVNTDSSSESGDEHAYYGGYGRCFHCGRRGHWANGCPDRW